MIEEAQETSVSFWEMLINEWVFGMQGKDMEQIVRRKINATRETMVKFLLQQQGLRQ